MPYRKPYRPKRRPMRRKPQYSYFGKAGIDAQKAVRMAGKALSLLNVEYKYADDTQTLTPFVGTPDFALLTGVPQGDTAASRDGNSVKLTSLDLNIVVQPHPTTPSRGTIRMVLVRDENSSTASIAPGDVYSSAVGAAPEILAQRNISYTKRWTVLKEKIITIDPSNGPAERYYQIHLNFVNQHLKFNGVAATNQTDGKVYLLCFSNIVGLGSAPQITYSSRIRFLDN